MPDAVTIFWFRNDLRLDDQPGLREAARRGAVVPVYVLDETDHPWKTGGAARWWLHHSLAALGERLAGAGSALVLRRGDPAQELRTLARETGADRVHVNAPLTPDEETRDEALMHELDADGVGVERFAPNLLWPVGSVLTKAGEPYQVFTPFWRCGLAGVEPEAPVNAPRTLHAPTEPVRSLSLDDLGLLPAIDWAGGMRARWTPGEEGAKRDFKAFLRDRLDAYADGRDRLDVAGWSAASPRLHFGELSVRRVWHTVAGSPVWQEQAGRESYLREVGWREFAHHLLFHFPRTTDEPLRESFDRFPWKKDGRGLRAWQRGMTGYPVVDAAMRNLWSEGWMPNRARMIVASFLCKDLLIPWQRGAEWFWDTLVDADLASNTLGWQWTSGCGADAAPYFRVFNPVSQGEKFDPRGDYVRRWVPELARLDARIIHKPWEASPLELRAGGVTLGETYPERVVDHAEARERALAAFDRIKG